MPSRALLPVLLLAALPAVAALPPGAGDGSPAQEVSPQASAASAVALERQETPPPLLFSEEGGRLEVRSSDFLQPVTGPASACDGASALRTLGVWQPLGSPPLETEVASSAPGDLSRVVAASTTGYAYCDCTLAGITAYASTCAPDCHSDCDEGHDGTTCHVHQYYRYGSDSFATFIDDFVDCCECSSLTANDCGNSVNTGDCGFCAGGCVGGYPSCCVYSWDLFVRQRSVKTSNSVSSGFLRLRRGTNRFVSNEILVTQGGREDCLGGSRDGWQSYSFPPDRSVSSFRVGAYVNSTWPCDAAAPTLSGSGFTCTCYEGAFTCPDGYCDGTGSDPDCADCSLQDGVCLPGCENYSPDPDCRCNGCTEF
jgi:hypothetical protein